MSKVCIIKQPQTSVNQPIPSKKTAGVEESTFQIKPLPSATIFSQLNKLFRLNLPSQRDLTVWQTLCKKSVSSSISLTDTDSKISLANLKQLAIEVVNVSLNLETIEAVEPTPADYLIQLIILIEDLNVFAQNTWLAESLELLGEYHQGGLHGHYFKQDASPENFKTLLEYEGYRTDCFDWGVNTQQAFLLGMGLTHIFPWQAILKLIPQEESHLQYLHRLKRISQFIEQQPTPLPDLSLPITGSEIMGNLLKRIDNWLENEFSNKK